MTKKVGDGGDGKVSNTKAVSKRGIQRKYWSFTIPIIWGDIFGDLEIKTQEDIKKIMKALEAEYIFQAEAGGESDYLHFQGSLELKGKGKRLEEILKIAKCGHWEPSRSISADKYAGKSETRIEGPWMYPYRYLGEDLPQRHQLYKWQENILKIIDGPVDGRKVYWVVDPIGGKGKSTFAKYIDYNYEGVMICGGELKDIAFAITEMRPVERPIIIFDIVRAHKNRLSYASLEALKNGHFFSQKYESKKYLGPKPHVIVFSNYEPEYDKLSQDRWEIINI